MTSVTKRKTGPVRKTAPKKEQIVEEPKLTEEVSNAFVVPEEPQPIVDLPANAFQHEILRFVCQQRTNGEKIDVLRKYRNDALVSLFIWNYDDSVISMLPEGDVPYSRVQDQTSGNDTLSGAVNKQLNSNKIEEYYTNSKTSLRKEASVFYNFLKGGNDALPNIRRETMFINLLEGLHPLEAEILILVKDKKLTQRYDIPWGLIREAYPDITWGGRS